MKKKHFYILITLFLIIFNLGYHQLSHAQDEVESDENYDPFSDYTEFTEASTEEADINFFRNGRLLNIGLYTGLGLFTGGYSDFYKPGLTLGLYMTYFFDLQFAFQLGVKQTDHDFTFKQNDGNNFNGTVRLRDINLYAKYFFNTQNMTRVFAEWNPYIIGGVSQITRSFSNGKGVFTNDNTIGYDIGAGVEYIFNKKRNYAGVVLLYQYATFPTEGSRLIDPSGTGSGYTNLKESGDPITLMGTIGINF